ncbi:phenylalanine--tRNA ligase beta subunit-related protein [Microbacterium sp. BK668]|uniref:B3/B4 domain-containing protein n=1 Tax=Microbacterium sp. BK668 TaxID=2512118 RepID=UPI0010DB50F9|nr:phenylalanine--tRNA ligase beta subunit-related protein [Microbacterium sp. BK668]TDN91082.1 phosphoenolpyruvate synthase [Microbacterium sp. BK668]
MHSAGRFRHDPELLREFPQLAVATLAVDGVTGTADVSASTAPFLQRAAARLAERPESEFPEIAAWRRAFSQMGLKPTQYRCASEALLRRYRLSGELPAIHPLVDVCNAVSLAYAIPIAVFDLDRVQGDLIVTHAAGDETYLSFSGEVEAPDPREVVFRDDAGNAHARRWTNRQSALSAIRPDTRRVLIVSEALHAAAAADIELLRDDLADAIARHWGRGGR